MSNQINIKVGSKESEEIEMTVSEDRIFIKGLWKGYTSKSKKGNMNMSWHNKELFDELIEKYLGNHDIPEESEVPF